MDDDLGEYDLEHYDDDEDAQDTGGVMAMFSNQSLVYHESNADDPYITMPDQEDDEEREELQILATDNLVLAGRVEDEVAHLEVYVYEDEADNLYVHHDIMLPAIPLAVEWLDVAVGKTGAEAGDRGNFAAVGTMEPDIELWNLDVVDGMYPDAILGAGADAKPERAKKKKKKAKKANDEHHVDAVLALAANRNHRNLMASGSADQTVKLWDVSTTRCAKSYAQHTDKVCSLAWHPAESTVLLSGSYDKTVVAGDMRTPDAQAPRWAVESDVETVRWNPHDANYFYVSTEKGAVHYHDARTAPRRAGEARPVWTLQAHDEAVAALDVNAAIAGFVATGSADKRVKLWKVAADTGPSMVVSRDMGVGQVFATTFAPDADVGFRLAVAGSKGAVHVWDTSTNAAVRAAFAGRVPQRSGAERVVGVDKDDDDDGDGSSASGAGEAMDEGDA